MPLIINPNIKHTFFYPISSESIALKTVNFAQRFKLHQMTLTLPYEALTLPLFCTINGQFDPININDTFP